VMLKNGKHIYNVTNTNKLRTEKNTNKEFLKFNILTFFTTKN